MDEGVATADAVAESYAERWLFSGGRASETGSSGGTHVAPSERWRSGWDHEFESPLLQRRVLRDKQDEHNPSTRMRKCRRMRDEGRA